MSLSLKRLYSDVEVDFHAVRLLYAGFITAGEDSSVVLFKDGSVMGNHHNSSSFRIEFQEEFHDPVSRLSIEIAGRFIGYYDLRRIEQSPCNRDSLLLSA